MEDAQQTLTGNWLRFGEFPEFEAADLDESKGSHATVTSPGLGTQSTPGRRHTRSSVDIVRIPANPGDVDLQQGDGFLGFEHIRRLIPTGHKQRKPLAQNPPVGFQRQLRAVVLLGEMGQTRPSQSPRRCGAEKSGRRRVGEMPVRAANPLLQELRVPSLGKPIGVVVAFHDHRVQRTHDGS
jgi:hypothetical protein